MLVMFCLVHISMNGYYILHPDLPAIRVYKKNLQDIDFPLAFKLCATETRDTFARYNNVGYVDDFDFFLGRSMYNASLFGWTGHTVNGSTFADVEGRIIIFVKTNSSNVLHFWRYTSRCFIWLAKYPWRHPSVSCRWGVDHRYCQQHHLAPHPRVPLLSNNRHFRIFTPHIRSTTADIFLIQQDWKSGGIFRNRR